MKINFGETMFSSTSLTRLENKGRIESLVTGCYSSAVGYGALQRAALKKHIPASSNSAAWHILPCDFAHPFTAYCLKFFVLFSLRARGTLRRRSFVRVRCILRWGRYPDAEWLLGQGSCQVVPDVDVWELP